jgi:predicted dehydrogenase
MKHTEQQTEQYHFGGDSLSDLESSVQFATKEKGLHKTSPSNTPTIALVGCGAIAEKYHLPALAKHQSVLDNLVLVDMNEARLRELASEFKVHNYVSDYREVLNEVDGAIVAVPHHLHHSISMDFLGQGAHVLCEKPLAESAADAKAMVAQALKSGVTLSVNNTRRLFPAYLKVKELISEGALGDLISINYVDGEVFRWPTTSGFYFKKGAPTGVLLDRGVHGLDTICWWLDGKPEVIRSENDSFGGVEGVALLELQHDDCTINVKLSWLTKLENSYTIVGELGTIEGGIEEWGSVRISYPSGKTVKIKFDAKEKVYNDFGDKMLANFIEVIRAQAAPVVSASDVIPSIELIEACYQKTTRLHLPWYDILERHNGQ